MTRKLTLILEHPKYQPKKTLDEMYWYIENQVQVLKRSAYGMILAPEKPGSFYLVWKHLSNNVHHEYVFVDPSGFEFRKTKFGDLNELFAFFKQSEASKAASSRRPVERGGRRYEQQDPRMGSSGRAPPRPSRGYSNSRIY
jgi:transcription elongation factor SPT6